VQRGPRSPSTPRVNGQPVTVASVPEDGAGDASLRFVSDLAADVDLDAALDAGLVPQGGADRALAQMDQRERVALQRLLSEALTNGGA
jgi:hypothetical protein